MAHDHPDGPDHEDDTPLPEIAALRALPDDAFMPRLRERITRHEMTIEAVHFGVGAFRETLIGMMTGLAGIFRAHQPSGEESIWTRRR